MEPITISWWATILDTDCKLETRIYPPIKGTAYSPPESLTWEIPELIEPKELSDFTRRRLEQEIERSDWEGSILWQLELLDVERL